MVGCNNEDAIRAREIAIKKMEDNEFAGARKIVLETQKLFPELECAQMLAVCDVHCAAGARVNGKMDWYAILQVEVAVDKTIIRKQYLRLTRLLHTDKNKFPGAEAAFKCPRCWTKYKHYICILNKPVCCQMCPIKFVAADLKAQAMPTLSSVARGSEVTANMFPNQKSDTPSQQDDHVKPSPAIGFTAEKFQFSTLNEDKFSVLTENENMHGKSMPYRADPNIVNGHKSGTEDASALAVPGPAKLCSLSGKAIVKPNVNVVDNTREEVKFSTPTQDKLSVLTETGSMHGRTMVGPADRNNLGMKDAYAVPDARNIPRSPKYYSGGEKADGQSAVYVAPGNEGCSSEHGGKKHDRSDIIHQGVKTSMTNKNTGERLMPDPAALNVVGLTNLVREEASTGPGVVRYYCRRQSGTRKQDADGRASPSSDRKKRQRKNDLPSTHVDMNCKKTIYDDVTSVDSQSARTLASSKSKVNIQEKAGTTDISICDKDISSGQDTSLHRFVFVDSSDPDWVSSYTIHIYPDPEFHNFDEDRSFDKFERGQIWALYDDVNAFPKLYGWISKVEPAPFIVHLIWLEACSQQEKEMFVSCGTFRILNQRARFGTTETFSHLVDARGTSVQRQVEILPQVGEIWAIYTPDRAPTCKFAIGEIVERTEASTRLSILSKVDGYVAVFKPDKRVLEIPAREKLRFSHRIPCFRLTEERGGKLRGLYELDPASVPDAFLPRI